jgi:hypothetical protein
MRTSSNLYQISRKAKLVPTSKKKRIKIDYVGFRNNIIPHSTAVTFKL